MLALERRITWAHTGRNREESHRLLMRLNDLEQLRTTGKPSPYAQVRSLRTLREKKFTLLSRGSMRRVSPGF